MRLWQHSLAAVPLGAALYWASGDGAAAASGAAASVFLDLDHLLDYLRWRRGWRGFDDFFGTSLRHQWPTGLFVLHAWELVPLIALALYLTAGPVWALALAAGWAWHLALDQIANHVQPPFYFFCYRARMGFRMSTMLSPEGRRVAGYDAPLREDAAPGAHPAGGK